MMAVAADEEIAIFRTPMITMKFINAATIALEVDFSPTVTEFGSMVDILGVGVLIRGVSGIGKSECNREAKPRTLVDHPAKELDSGTKANIVFLGIWGARAACQTQHRRQAADDCRLRSPRKPCFCETPFVVARRFGNRRSLLFPPRQGKR